MMPDCNAKSDRIVRWGSAHPAARQPPTPTLPNLNVIIWPSKLCRTRQTVMTLDQIKADFAMQFASSDAPPRDIPRQTKTAITTVSYHSGRKTWQSEDRRTLPELWPP